MISPKVSPDAHCVTTIFGNPKYHYRAGKPRLSRNMVEEVTKGDHNSWNKHHWHNDVKPSIPFPIKKNLT